MNQKNLCFLFQGIDNPSHTTKTRHKTTNFPIVQIQNFAFQAFYSYSLCYILFSTQFKYLFSFDNLFLISIRISFIIQYLLNQFLLIQTLQAILFKNVFLLLFKKYEGLGWLTTQIDQKNELLCIRTNNKHRGINRKANSITSIQLKSKTTTKNIKSPMKKEKNMKLDAVFQSNYDANSKNLQVFIQNIISVQSEIIKTSNLDQEHQVKFQEPHHLEVGKKLPGKKILNQSIQWTAQQTDTLFELFQKWGSKWTKISQQMRGRSENCIKNRFYGNLRKVLRRMNKAAKNLVKKFKKQLKFQSITRIIDASQGLFRLKSPLKEESETLTKKIIDLAKKENQQMTPEQAEILIKQINKFNMLTRSYKSQKKISNRKSSKRAQKPNPFNGNNSTNLNQLDQEKMQISEIEFEDQLHPSSTHQDDFMAQEIPKLKRMNEEEVELLNQKEREQVKQNRVRTYSQKFLQQILMSQIYSPLQFEAWI